MDRWQAVSITPIEGFAPNIDALIAATSGTPKNQDILLAYQTILKYIESDFSKGIYVVNDFKNRFFPADTPFKDNFNPSTVTSGPQLHLAPETKK
jgi:hypothetical protein